MSHPLRQWKAASHCCLSSGTETQMTAGYSAIQTRTGMPTAPNRHDGPKTTRATTWQKRKEMSLEMLKSSTDIGVKMLWLADKLSNMRSLAGAYGEIMASQYNCRKLPQSYTSDEFIS